MRWGCKENVMEKWMLLSSKYSFLHVLGSKHDLSNTQDYIYDIYWYVLWESMGVITKNEIQ